MASGDGSSLIRLTGQREFDLYALSLERGPNFEPLEMVSAYKLGRGSACGCILFDPQRTGFSTLTLRRRVDHRWILVDESDGFANPEIALDHIGTRMLSGSC